MGEIMEMKVPTMLTITETAERSGLPVSFIRKKCRRNEIVYIMAGKKYLVNWERFLNYLNGEEATLYE